MPDSTRLGEPELKASTQWKRWERRDFLAGAALFLATAAFVLWQNSQIAILWDLSYLLDTSYRIALGQMPYRDFPLVHPPLTFLLQAGIMRLAGRHYFLHVAYAAFVGGLATVVAWRVILRFLENNVARAWWISLLLAAPLTVLGVYSIYPHPIYDCDAGFAILVAIFLLQRLRLNQPGQGTLLRQWAMAVSTGAAVVLPVFFKQNMGVPFLALVVAGILLLLLLSQIKSRINKDRLSESTNEPSSAILFKVLVAICAAMLAALGLIQVTAGLDNYLHWTIHFAAQRRLPGFSEMLTVYQQPFFAWTLPTVGCGLILVSLPIVRRTGAKILALCLLSAPLLGSILYLFLNDDLDERGDNLLALWPMLLIVSAVVALIELRKGVSLGGLTPFFILAAIHGTFLSQQLWGSTYAIWPLLILLIAQMLTAAPSAVRQIVLPLAIVVSATFLICGGLYAAGHERMNYLNIPDQPLYRATLPALREMADRGPYLPDFEELVRFAAKEIPPQDGILLLPGEEPFFFASGRVPEFPVQIFDNTTDPYSAAALLEAARQHNIRWVIVKTRLQSNEDPLPDRALVLSLITKEFTLFHKLGGYDIYLRSKEAAD
ncbi:hypothetical protein [Acidicapsa acidisoli]|uniref:hypothetical protein n=1 Tax=Acidicapsa acidisoli TaxID=1615681 RepID=UPI0021DFDF11|nr:hypothetical protein [Acidicapsa acidisoli]